MTGRKMLTLVIAIILTSTAVAMAAFSAIERGGVLSDRVLLVVVSVVITILAHLLLSLTSSKLAWLLWGGCLIVTIYGHTVFFTNSINRAGEQAVRHSLQSQELEKQMALVTHALDGIVARPVTVVANELSVTREYRKRQALKKELIEAERAVSLSERLLTLTSQVSGVKRTQSHEQVAWLLSKVTGSSVALVTLIISISLATLVEFVGALLWYEVIRVGDARGFPYKASLVANDLVSGLHDRAATEESQMEKLVTAIKAGACKPTVASIRSFLGCGQAKAAELRRQLVA